MKRIVQNELRMLGPEGLRHVAVPADSAVRLEQFGQLLGRDLVPGQRSAVGCEERRPVVGPPDLRELEAACQLREESDRDWADAPLKELVDHIVNWHHTYLRHEHPHIVQRLTKVLEAHRRRHGFAHLLVDVLGELHGLLGISIAPEL